MPQEVAPSELNLPESFSAEAWAPFHRGDETRLYEKLGAHSVRHGAMEGVRFAVWAPNAESVSVMGDFNGWNPHAHFLERAGGSGIWTGVVPNIREAASYKYHIGFPGSDSGGAGAVEKADPFGFCHESPPGTASVVWDLAYEWGDDRWIGERKRRNSLGSPIAIYEVHLPSWRRVVEAFNRPLTYRELAPLLADYVERLGFTHVEFLPVMEHWGYDSWGYDVTGFFAPSSRYGAPQDFMFLIDFLHRRGIGVILDWVATHFSPQEHGLIRFDGTPLFEWARADTRDNSGETACTFDWSRPEVRSFLLSSATFWLDKYHADGLRLPSLQSALLGASPCGAVETPFPDARQPVAGVEFLRRLNEEIYRQFPDLQTFAEETSGWPAVSRPTYIGGLGFGFKWDTQAARDTLRYFGHDPIFRKYQHEALTVRSLYASSENFVFALPHDEVAPGKASLLGRMPGDAWHKFANLRLLLAYVFLQPGKKLLFMGGEFGQWQHWQPGFSLDWHLLEDARHAGIQKCVADLNRLYRSDPALHAGDAEQWGFEWVDHHDAEQSTLSWLRWSAEYREVCLAVFNFTPVVRRNYRVGAPSGGFWKEILNTDAREYGGSGQGNLGGTEAAPFPWHDRAFMLTVALPPLAAVVFKRQAV